MTFTDDGVPIWNDGSWNLWPLPFATSLCLPFCQQKLVIFVEENPWYFGEKSKTSQRRVLQMGEEPRERSSALRPSQLDMKDMNKAAFCYPDWHRPFAPGILKGSSLSKFFFGPMSHHHCRPCLQVRA